MANEACGVTGDAFLRALETRTEPVEGGKARTACRDREAAVIEGADDLFAVLTGDGRVCDSWFEAEEVLLLLRLGDLHGALWDVPPETDER